MKLHIIRTEIMIFDGDRVFDFNKNVTFYHVKKQEQRREIIT